MTTTGVSASYPIVGEFTARDPYSDLDTGVVVAAPATTAAHRLDIVAATATQADVTQAAVLAVLARTDPSDLQVQSPASLAQIQAGVLGDLARYNRSLTILVLLAGALLVAVVALADVLIHRTEIGRRRALGAPRWALTSILIGRSLVGALAGAVLGVTSAAIVTIRMGQRPDVAFTVEIAVLAVLTTALATTIPALIAARQDPVRVLRTP
ncbi:MAG TPA: FtsX-like permease family protein [Propionicimonas sp.]|jgi:putative ABC transport system permease protein